MFLGIRKALLIENTSHITHNKWGKCTVFSPVGFICLGFLLGCFCGFLQYVYSSIFKQGPKPCKGGMFVFFTAKTLAKPPNWHLWHVLQDHSPNVYTGCTLFVRWSIDKCWTYLSCFETPADVALQWSRSWSSPSRIGSSFANWGVEHHIWRCPQCSTPAPRIVMCRTKYPWRKEIPMQSWKGMEKT